MCLMPGAGEAGAEGGRANIVERDGERAPRRRRNDWLQSGEHALAVALAERLTGNIVPLPPTSSLMVPLHYQL